MDTAHKIYKEMIEAKIKVEEEYAYKLFTNSFNITPFEFTKDECELMLRLLNKEKKILDLFKPEFKKKPKFIKKIKLINSLIKKLLCVSMEH